jgi:hypothetical protein
MLFSNKGFHLHKCGISMDTESLYWKRALIAQTVLHKAVNYKAMRSNKYKKNIFMHFYIRYQSLPFLRNIFVRRAFHLHLAGIYFMNNKFNLKFSFSARLS